MLVILLLCSRNNVSEFDSIYRIKFQVELRLNTEFISSVQLHLTKFCLMVTNSMQETVESAKRHLYVLSQGQKILIYWVKYVHNAMEPLTNDNASELAVFNLSKAIILWFDTHNL